MKKSKIVLKSLIVILILLVIFSISIYASTSIDTNIAIGTTTAINSSNRVIGNFVGIFQRIGSVVSVIALIIIGFRYMFSSLEEKAQLKGVIWYYIVGAILVFATSNVLSIVYNIFQGF